jgi:hypothetical protein
MPYAGIYQFTEGRPNPDHEALRSLFLDAVDLPTAETIVEHLQASTAPLAVAQLRVLGGAMARVPADATAFAHRQQRIMAAVGAIWGACRGDGRPRGLGRRVRGGVAPGRPGRVRQLRRRRGPSAGPGGLPGIDLGPPGRGQTPLRPHQPVPTQPEHPTGAPASRAVRASPLDLQIHAHHRLVDAGGLTGWSWGHSLRLHGSVTDDRCRPWLSRARCGGAAGSWEAFVPPVRTIG